MCGCPGGSTGRVLGLQPRQPREHWFESQSRRKKTSQVLQPTHPSVKWVPGLVLGNMAVSHWSLKASVGLRVPTPACSERHSWCSCEFLARLQEIAIIAQQRHTVPAWCTGALASPGTRDPCFCFLLFLLVCVSTHV